MYEEARKLYASYGIDTEKAIKMLERIPVSINCWQGDDVIGFEKGAGPLSGGIQTTGNYPGRARNADELMADFEKAIEYIPGSKRLNLHASYLVTDRKCDRDSIEPEDYKVWVEFAKKNNLGLDFNPTCFSHPMVKDNLTLSSPDKSVRDFWIRHSIRSRKVGEYFAKELGTHSLVNLWIPDGFKDTPADRLAPRKRLWDALDEIYAEQMDGVVDSVESKVFGIGVESFTVGSNEFYIGYAASHKEKNLCVLLDAGHFHPQEFISDKLSAMLLLFDKIPLHVSRPVRWDSDHVVALNDELREIAKEIISNDAMDRVLIGLDFFDASINRLAAWIIGTRNMQKALMQALLMPHEQMHKLQENADFTSLLALSEEIKSLPWSVVWDEYLDRQGVAKGISWLDDIHSYENEVLRRR